jgi:hypothetical protein
MVKLPGKQIRQLTLESMVSGVWAGSQRVERLAGKATHGCGQRDVENLDVFETYLSPSWTEPDGAGTHANQQRIQLPAPTRALQSRSEGGSATTLAVVTDEPIDTARGAEHRRPCGTARRNVSPETAVPIAAALSRESSVGRAGQTTAPPLGVVTRALQRAGASLACAIDGGAQRRVCVCPGLRVCHGAIHR